MLSTSYQDVVHFERQARPRRGVRLRGPLAALLTIAAVVGSGVVMTRLDDASTRASLGAHQPQPFDYFPR